MAFELDMEELLTGDIVRLRYVTRYSNCRRIHNESTAEHSFFVCLFGSIVADWVENHAGVDLDWRRLAIGFAIHDADEALSGDFPRAFKYADSTLQSMLKSAASGVVRHLFDKIFKAPRTSKHARGYSPYYTEIWFSAKDMESVEGRIVCFADFISVVSYLVQETQAGNRAVIEREEVIVEYFKMFEGTEFDFIRPLVDQVRPLVGVLVNL